MISYTPPPDKSLTIRALLLAAISGGSARVENPLLCDDTEAAIRSLEALGIKICRDGNSLIIKGLGLKGLKKPAEPLNAGESGTLARLLAGILAGQDFPSVITGSGSLLKRPMEPLAAALKKTGADIQTANGRLPVSIKPARMKGHKISGVESAQIKSALLLAGLYAGGPSGVREKYPSRDHTERLLALMGARITKKGLVTGLEPGQLTARPVTVPGDISSAAPFIAAALISGRELKINACGLNPTRLGFVRALQKMGARIELKIEVSFPEPSGGITVFPSSLKGLRVKPEDIPSMADEVPLLAVVAAKAKGQSVISGIGSLRTKESDRIESALALLGALGVKATYRNRALRITGSSRFRPVKPAETFSDHRIAMAAAAASTAAPGLEIRNPGCVNKSYPGFWKDFKKVFGPTFSF